MHPRHQGRLSECLRLNKWLAGFAKHNDPFALGIFDAIQDPFADFGWIILAQELKRWLSTLVLRYVIIQHPFVDMLCSFALQNLAPIWLEPFPFVPCLHEDLLKLVRFEIGMVPSTPAAYACAPTIRVLRTFLSTNHIKDTIFLPLRVGIIF